MTTKNNLPHWNYLDRTMHPRWDFTQLDKLPTDTDSAKLNALNARINARNEEIEDMFIEIELANIEREENKPAKKPQKRAMRRQELFEDIDEATRAELLSEGYDIE